MWHCYPFPRWFLKMLNTDFQLIQKTSAAGKLLKRVTVYIVPCMNLLALMCVSCFHHIAKFPLTSPFITLHISKVCDLSFGSSLPMIQNVQIVRPEKGELGLEPVCNRERQGIEGDYTRV